MTTTSGHIPNSDPLEREHRRIWDLLLPLIRRQAQLEGLGRRTTTQQIELTALRGRVDGLRRQTGRICEVLRTEAWARHEGGRGG